jgi:hypothetical protein
MNLIVGWGFSSNYYKYGDGHVGNFNLLLEVGVLGFLIWVYFWSYYFLKIREYHRYLNYFNYLKRPLNVLIIAQVGMLILHFTSYQFFGYNVINYGMFFLIIFYSLSNTILNESLEIEKSGGS